MNEPAFPMTGHVRAEARFLKAKALGRLHHGWIIQGPSGIGKSIFARRLAALMLGAERTDASVSDPVMRSLRSESHPDLKWVARETNDKDQLKQDISVDQIRQLNQFFSLKPALSGWRVGVIDSLDEMNVNGQNALLKTLEEPPANAILFLISHLEGPVLDTIRSRCQTVRLFPLSEAETKTVLEAYPEKAELAAQLASGRPGYGLRLATPQAARAARAAQQLVQSLERPQNGLLAACVMEAIADDSSLQVFIDYLLNWTAEAAQKKPHLAHLWQSLSYQRAKASQLNLTPLQTATRLVAVLQKGLTSRTA